MRALLFAARVTVPAPPPALFSSRRHIDLLRVNSAVCRTA